MRALYAKLRGEQVKARTVRDLEDALPENPSILIKVCVKYNQLEALRELLVIKGRMPKSQLEQGIDMAMKMSRLQCLAMLVEGPTHTVSISKVLSHREKLSAFWAHIRAHTSKDLEYCIYRASSDQVLDQCCSQMQFPLASQLLPFFVKERRPFVFNKVVKDVYRPELHNKQRYTHWDGWNSAALGDPFAVICSYLDHRDVGRLSRVSKQFQRMSERNAVWDALLRRELGVRQRYHSGDNDTTAASKQVFREKKGRSRGSASGQDSVWTRHNTAMYTVVEQDWSKVVLSTSIHRNVRFCIAGYHEPSDLVYMYGPMQALVQYSELLPSLTVGTEWHNEVEVLLS